MKNDYAKRKAESLHPSDSETDSQDNNWGMNTNRKKMKINTVESDSKTFL